MCNEKGNRFVWAQADTQRVSVSNAQCKYNLCSLLKKIPLGTLKGYICTCTDGFQMMSKSLIYEDWLVGLLSSFEPNPSFLAGYARRLITENIKKSTAITTL